ncbi:MAG: site-2 protease family protein, partial [Pseudomonadota bacterium]
VILTPKNIVDTDSLGNKFTHPIIGIMTKNMKIEEVGLLKAIGESVRRTYYFCTTTLKVLGQIVTGKRSFSDNIQGPIGMAKISGQAAEKGLSTVFILMANISASLGLINLFPIPMLDGGHLLYYAIEFVRGRPLARRFQEYGLKIGMSLIAMLMAYSIFNDIYKWVMAA